MAKKIMFVDDETQVLKALVRTFMDTDYYVCCAESGKQALELMEKDNFDLIVSDMRMPNMDGYQLLCEMKARYPKTLRIILSGYSDERVVLKALQRNIAKFYIFKPWENDNLVKLVDQIFETEKILTDNNLLALINNIDELPTVNTNYQNIISSIDNDGDVIEISRLIEQDPSITSKLLHIANSAYYGVKTGSIKQAITYLGLANVRNLILSTSIIDSFSKLKAPEKILQDLWKHAYITNKLLFKVYENFLDKKLPETCMSAGLLHNVGVIFLIQIFKDKHIICIKDVIKSKKSLIKLEYETFGISHHEAGGYLMMWWDLPFPIVETALYHHDPFNDNIVNKELMYAVHIAERYSWRLMGIDFEPCVNEEAFKLLGMEKGIFEEKLAQMSIV